MNLKLSTSYAALHMGRSWRAERAATSVSRFRITFGTLSALTTTIVNAVHQFVDPRGFAMKQLEANLALEAATAPVLESPASIVADTPAVTHVIWAPTYVAPRGGALPSFPILAALDDARGADKPGFATDPNAALLEQRACQLTDQHWSEYVWLTGFVTQSRFDLVCDALERDRLSQSPVNIADVSTQPSRIAS